MPSPFPGMDPWLERPGLFPDLHQTLIAEVRAAINAALPRPYYTALGTRLYVEDVRRRIEPDIDVLAPPKRTKRSPAGGTATAEPARPLPLRILSDPVREWTIEIRRTDSGDRLVTSVELLSPSNKAQGSRGRKSYLRKRREVRHGRANVVEIDLLRAGAPTTLAPLDDAARRYGPFDYHACVVRYYRRSTADFYPVRMTDRLPALAVPLLKGDPDVTAEIQPAFDRAYDVARFDQRAGYARPADPPLTADQLAWAETLLKGVRT